MFFFFFSLLYRFFGLVLSLCCFTPYHFVWCCKSFCRRVFPFQLSLRFFFFLG